VIAEVILGGLAVFPSVWAGLMYRDRERAIHQAARLTERLRLAQKRLDHAAKVVATAVEQRDEAVTAARRPPPTPSPHPRRVSPGMERITARTHRPYCPRPDKKAYDADDAAEMRIMEANTSDGLVPYICGAGVPERGCGFTHLGHPRPSPVPLDGPRAWVRDSTRIDLLTGTGTVHATGTAIAFHQDPTLIVHAGVKRITWPAGMTRLHQPADKESSAAS
jgi:hypothetical protein